MGYWTSFGVEMEFIPRNKEVVEFALKHFQKCLAMEGAYEVNGDKYTLVFNDSWKNRNAFFEDIIRTVEKHSTILECNIFESGEETSDQHDWKIVDGVVKKVHAIRDTAQETQTENLEELFEELDCMYFEIREFSPLGDTELETDEIVNLIEDAYAGTEGKGFEAFLEFLEKKTDGDYGLIIDTTEDSYQIICNKGKVELFELKATSSPDKIMSLDEIIQQQKMINNQLNGYANFIEYNTSYISEIDFENAQIQFEDNDGISRPFHPFFLDEFFESKKRGETHHILDGEELSLCGMCVNKMKQVIGDCKNCAGATLMFEPEEKLLLKIKN